MIVTNRWGTGESMPDGCEPSMTSRENYGLETLVRTRTGTCCIHISSSISLSKTSGSIPAAGFSGRNPLTIIAGVSETFSGLKRSAIQTHSRARFTMTLKSLQRRPTASIRV